MKRPRMNHNTTTILKWGLPVATCIAIAALLLAIFIGGSRKEKHIRSARDLADATIGVQLGTTSDMKVSALERQNPKTKVERFTKTADAVQALIQGKVDCVIEDEQPAKAFVGENPGLKLLPQTFSSNGFAFCVAKENKPLCDKINTALTLLSNSGTTAMIVRHHIDRDTSGYVPHNIGRPNGTLIVATNATFPPYEYYEHGKVVGIDIDIMQAVCDILGMKMRIEDMNFDAVITSVQTGKADVGAAGLTVTRDRLANARFTNTYTDSRQMMIVRDSDRGTMTRSLTEKFKNDFITEGRYLYLLQGLGNTLLITFFAIIISLILGSAIAIVRATHDRTGRMRILNAICQVYLALLRGTPTMVQLLIIYYVVFASVDVSKVFVAVVAFAINSSAYLAEVVRGGIMSVDRGQMEAGRCLGLSYGQTMRLVILPQAYKNVLPAIGNELITLLKETSIAGYIGIVDLTKGSDIIRSITYDAILPLTTVALIYLALVFMLTTVVNKLEKNLRKNERR